LVSISGLAQTNAGASSIFIDEFDARGFQGSADYIKRSSPRLVGVRFKLANGHYADAGLFSQIQLIPIQQPPRCSTLRRCKHRSLRKR
jgi:hypothetical protein